MLTIHIKNGLNRQNTADYCRFLVNVRCFAMELPLRWPGL